MCCPSIHKSYRHSLLISGYEDNMVLMGKANMIEGFDISHIPYDKIGFFYMVSRNFDIFIAPLR